MNFPQTFKKSIFNKDELDRFQKALDVGHYLDLPSLVEEMTPEKEIEIQKLQASVAPALSGFEDKVKSILVEIEHKEQLSIKTPEQEREIQLLIETELDCIKEKNKLLQGIKELEFNKSTNEDANKNINDTVLEMKNLIKKINKKLEIEITPDIIRGILKEETFQFNRKEQVSAFAEKIQAEASVNTPEDVLPAEQTPVIVETSPESLPVDNSIPPTDPSNSPIEETQVLQEENAIVSDMNASNIVLDSQDTIQTPEVPSTDNPVNDTVGTSDVRYFCKTCKRNHLTNSKLGKEHLNK